MGTHISEGSEDVACVRVVLIDLGQGKCQRRVMVASCCAKDGKLRLGVQKIWLVPSAILTGSTAKSQDLTVPEGTIIRYIGIWLTQQQAILFFFLVSTKVESNQFVPAAAAALNM